MRNVLRTAGFIAIACLLLSDPGRGQSAPSIFLPGSELGPFVAQMELPRSDGGADLQFGRQIALDGDTALVAGTDIVYVYDRTPGTDVWAEAAPITLPGVVNFGAPLAFDGRTAIVGSAAHGAAYVFRRRPNGTWREVATLTPEDERENFGGSVAIDGGYAIVGSPGSGNSPLSFVPGAAYVFQRNASDGQPWQQVAKIELDNPMGFTEAINFGARVDISEPTAFVTSGRGAYLFDRDAGGPNGWGRIRLLGFLGPGVNCCTSIAIDHDTAFVGHVDDFAPNVPPSTIYDRNEGGLNAWGRVAAYADLFSNRGVLSNRGVTGRAEISGDKIGFRFRGVPFAMTNEVHVLALNQRGPSAWGAVSRLLTPFTTAASGISLSGDTMLIGNAAVPDPSNPGTPLTPGSVIVMVFDLDGDGLRDGVDPCVRDPFNNVGGGCRRASSASLNLDHAITETAFSMSAPQANLRVLTATYTNSSDLLVRNPFFEVTEINGQNLLRNSDEGPAGMGATLSPDVGDAALSPGETMQVEFVIRYRSHREPLAFSVAFHGEATSCNFVVSTPPSPLSFSAGAGFGSASVSADAGCTWTASSNQSFARIDTPPGGTGSGNRTVTYFVDPNIGAARTATLTIAGQNFTVTQAAAP